jgi:hypothetical protein
MELQLDSFFMETERGRASRDEALAGKGLACEEIVD